MARVFKRSDNWFIDYRADGKRYREKIGPSKRDAVRCLAKRQTEVAEGRFLNIRKRCKVTFNEFKPKFLAWSKTHKRSWRRDERSVRNLSSYFGRMNLEAITPANVEKYKARRLSGALIFGGDHARLAGPSTINRELAALRKLLNLALEWDIMEENQLAGRLKMFKEPEGRIRYLEPVEAELLLASCNEYLRPVVHMALLSGMRLSEILGLAWSEVSLGRGTIRLPASRCKNGRERIVPLSMAARAVLAEAKRARVEGSDLVFHRGDGKPMLSIRGAFANACKRAQITDFKFHDLRHCYASALAMRGVSLQAIAEVLGHRTLSQTARYAHLSPSTLVNAAEQAALYLSTEQPAKATTAEPTPIFSNEKHQATG